ncbi:hypothetical protein EV189_1265 [Motilibacter rhizosphaerae]|uniref:Uncharacterized protein n=1 Tax=Motilibacter rhizosphaerae TaxID=598652 RepID=A0A4Q7NRV0_9ACTN|nr:hypothetical protein [Motilibacter rhizosphaerae]RZS89498.1 hypothetical protein EV189_1265 [Motilibacter rhizosphaerae]
MTVPDERPAGTDADADEVVVPAVPGPASGAGGGNPAPFAFEGDALEQRDHPEREAHASGEREPGASDGPEGGFAAPV